MFRLPKKKKKKKKAQEHAHIKSILFTAVLYKVAFYRHRAMGGWTANDAINYWGQIIRGKTE